MKSLLTIALILLTSTMTLTSKMPAYKLYTAKGNNTDYSKLSNDAAAADIVFFGELHNNPICHWMQFELAKSLHKEKGNSLIIGSEMFEADDQLKIDEYFSDLIRQRNFEEEARTWNNYKVAYKPVLEFARENGLKYIATNIPRRYASLVARGNFLALEQLSPEAKQYVPKLPIIADMELPGYKQMAGMGGHGMPYIAESQAAKDATMAHFILKNHKPGMTFYHINGTYHTNNYEGIVFFIRQANHLLKVVTIASVEQDDISKLEEANEGLADYILVIPKSMGKTY
jgi:uncharacterized iron-regulated protein